MHESLRLMVSRRGSDLFLTAGFPPALKLDGQVTPVAAQSLSALQTQACANRVGGRTTKTKIQINPSTATSIDPSMTNSDVR